VRAYAKVNLALSVGPPYEGANPRTPAGFHPIASWMHSIDLFDDVDVEQLSPDAKDKYDIRWTPSAPVRSIVDWPLDQDLAVRAHRLLQEHTGKRLPVSLSVTKRIPVGAGLGGGSADAAAALMLINLAFDLRLPMADLVTLSRKLGSDVAYFLDDPPPRPALVSGPGDVVERLERVAGHLVLILPSFPCPTGAVYTRYDALGSRPLREEEIRKLARAGWIESSSLFNDLEPPAESVQPALAELRRNVRAASGQPVHMTGSGSGLFLAYAEEAEARRVARTLNGMVNGNATILRVKLI
jgi:4-diphosphocytidyl-2-C-methyl-D-erythritol kinase